MDPSLIISIIAVIVSIIAIAYSVIISQRSNSLQIMTDLFQEYRSIEFKDASRYVIDDLEKNCNPEDGYWQLKDPSRTRVLKVSHFFNNIGALVAYKIVDEDLIIGYMGSNILMVWDKLYPFLENERSHRLKKHGIGKEYQEHFEDLVCRVYNKKPDDILKNKLKLKKISDIKKHENAPGYNDPRYDIIKKDHNTVISKIK